MAFPCTAMEIIRVSEIDSLLEPLILQKASTMYLQCTVLWVKYSGQFVTQRLCRDAYLNEFLFLSRNYSLGYCTDLNQHVHSGLQLNLKRVLI